jgi:hypothetical protein
MTPEMRDKARAHLDLCERCDGQGAAYELIKEMLTNDTKSQFMLVALTEHWASPEQPDDYTTVWGGYGHAEVYATLEDTAEQLEQALQKHDLEECLIPCYTILDGFEVDMNDPMASYYDLAMNAEEYVAKWVANGGRYVQEEKKPDGQTAAKVVEEEGQVEAQSFFTTLTGEKRPTAGTTKDAPECDIYCPKCGESDPYPDGDPDIEYNRVYVPVYCSHCNSTYKVHFDLTGYCEFKEGEDDCPLEEDKVPSRVRLTYTAANEILFAECILNGDTVAMYYTDGTKAATYYPDEVGDVQHIRDIMHTYIGQYEAGICCLLRDRIKEVRELHQLLNERISCLISKKEE